ncbi:unnamed protein product [Ostreobium quekettii]|uniref:TF-B3 domain-containing protein n=1 Tax=Ostreobium quekettii TaxID=121088 RepID=A0A8S1J7M4_9CHLO|nr:unnamed protein product [Ostreobium quekettii]|eukprot:evm.model.scf_1833EXC.2 EVM.evm.TU.scf_1833EXC.2   scf_1833EXC:20212-24248(+)
MDPGCVGNVMGSDGDPGESQALNVARTLEGMGCTVFYEKPLTTSDANGSGRVVIPKAVAEQYFPHLDDQAGVPIEAADTLGNAYTFRFRFWINNQSRMYLLEGASEMHQRYDLKVGDVMIFAHMPDSTLIVAGRPMTEADIRKPPLRRVNNPQSGVKRDLVGQWTASSDCALFPWKKGSDTGTGQDMHWAVSRTCGVAPVCPSACIT